MLKDDPLFFERGVVEQLADVGPLLNEPPRPSLNEVTGSLLSLQLRSFIPQLIPFLFPLNEFFLDQFGRFGSHSGDCLGQVVDFRLNRAQALSNQSQITLDSLSVVAKVPQSLSCNPLSGFRRGGDSLQPVDDGRLQGIRPVGRTVAAVLALVITAGATVVVMRGVSPRASLGDHVAAAGTANQSFERRLTPSGVACVGSLLAVLIQLPLDAGELFLGDDRLVGVFGAGDSRALLRADPLFAPDDVPQVDLVFEDAANALLLKLDEVFWLTTVCSPLVGILDATVPKVFENSTHRPQAFERIEDVSADDLRFVGVNHQPFGLLVLTIAIEKAAVPHPLSGTIFHGQSCPLPDHATLVFCLPDGHVPHEPALGIRRVINVVDRKKLDSVFLQ